MIDDPLREYVLAFGASALPDARRVPPAIWRRIEDLALDAVNRGAPLTDQELQLRSDPGPEAAI